MSVLVAIVAFKYYTSADDNQIYTSGEDSIDGTINATFTMSETENRDNPRIPA
jgi:hypothetical protein